MCLAANFAWCLGERHSGCLALLYAAVVCVLVNPFAWVDVGFQLSFVATAGILLTYKLWLRLIKLPVLASTLAPQFGVIPLISYYFSIFTLAGLICSPLVAMVAGITVAAVLIAMCLVPLGLADVPLYGAGLLCDLAYRLCAWLETVPGGWLPVAKTPLPLIFLYYILLIAAMLYLRKYGSRGETYV